MQNKSILDALNKTVLTDNNYSLTHKGLDLRKHVKSIFYIFRYAESNQDEYYNHLGFALVEELITYCGGLKKNLPITIYPMIGLYLLKFNHWGFMNLSLDKLLAEIDHHCIKLVTAPQTRFSLVLIAMLYMEQRNLQQTLPKELYNRLKIAFSKRATLNLDKDENISNVIFCLHLLIAFDKNYVKTYNFFFQEFKKQLALNVIPFNSDLAFVLNAIGETECLGGIHDKITPKDFLEEISMKNLKKESLPKLEKTLLEQNLKGVTYYQKIDLGIEMLFALKRDFKEQYDYYKLLNYL
ncbi:hypothetical protein J7E50_05605 [Pedobacter sp. ISL-68]|uniref:hypothetical protein n=1 Tax=unclassified Pedobacter TaxID=2628915 RepID=UPI001BEC9518|nr:MULTISPECIES: hypothetical protein [unclassified Pedobacter]MBT2564181.1 hypothetical protein [Pedobacter sp. ISL-64]MBT2589684.1 hypothetical protein [Pedobacter sp. ISL-68]